jgi:hypothetical protein
MKLAALGKAGSNWATCHAGLEDSSREARYTFYRTRMVADNLITWNKTRSECKCCAIVIKQSPLGMSRRSDPFLTEVQQTPNTGVGPLTLFMTTLDAAIITPDWASARQPQVLKRLVRQCSKHYMSWTSS